MEKIFSWRFQKFLEQSSKFRKKLHLAWNGFLKIIQLKFRMVPIILKSDATYLRNFTTILHLTISQFSS